MTVGRAQTISALPPGDALRQLIEWATEKKLRVDHWKTGSGDYFVGLYPQTQRNRRDALLMRESAESYNHAAWYVLNALWWLNTGPKVERERTRG